MQRVSPMFALMCLVEQVAAVGLPLYGLPVKSPLIWRSSNPLMVSSPLKYMLKSLLKSSVITPVFLVWVNCPVMLICWSVPLSLYACGAGVYVLTVVQPASEIKQSAINNFFIYKP